MKKVFTLLFSLMLVLGASNLMAQNLEALAEKETREMAAKLRLNEGEYLKLKQYNLERLEKIAALSNLREQDERYLDLRLDQIEEEYASMLFNTFDKKQYAAYLNYKEDQPYTYAGVASKNGLAAKASTVAMQAEE